MLQLKCFTPIICCLFLTVLVVITCCKKEHHNVAPTACFSITDTASIIYDTIYFVNCSKNADSVVYSFGDGQFSDAANPKHVYITPGTYVVKLTAYNDGDTNSVTRNLKILDTFPINPSLMDSFTGTYHLIGEWYGVGTVSGSGNIDTIITVSVYNDSMLALSGTVGNMSAFGPVTYEPASAYAFDIGGGDNWEQIVFRKPYNDSIFYTSEYGFASGYTSVQCQGAKIQ